MCRLWKWTAVSLRIAPMMSSRLSSVPMPCMSSRSRTLMLSSVVQETMRHQSILGYLVTPMQTTRSFFFPPTHAFCKAYSYRGSEV